MAKKYIPFYNIEKSVGKGGINSSEDVLLVQFFLSEIAKVPPHPIPPPVVPLTVNGMATPLLNDWIDWFQKAVIKAGKGSSKDGRIDPAIPHNGSMYTSTGTIVVLNASYRLRFSASHDALEKAPNCPGLLRSKFTANTN